jgi:hypothetical protein
LENSHALESLATLVFKAINAHALARRSNNPFLAPKSEVPGIAEGETLKIQMMHQV